MAATIPIAKWRREVVDALDIKSAQFERYLDPAFLDFLSPGHSNRHFPPFPVHAGSRGPSL